VRPGRPGRINLRELILLSLDGRGFR